MDSTYDYSKLLGKLREKGLTQLDVAKALGISECSLNRRLKNKSEFKQSEMIEILNLTSVKVDEISSYFFAR